MIESISQCLFYVALENYVSSQWITCWTRDVCVARDTGTRVCVDRVETNTSVLTRCACTVVYYCTYIAAHTITWRYFNEPSCTDLLLLMLNEDVNDVLMSRLCCYYLCYTQRLCTPSYNDTYSCWLGWYMFHCVGMVHLDSCWILHIQEHMQSKNVSCRLSVRL